MSGVAKSIHYFGFYLLLAGFALFFFPNFVLGLVGIPTTTDVWIHLVGALTFILGVFFVYMARQGSRPFSYISMFGRGTFTLAILLLILFYDAPVGLLLFALIDVAGLLWTLAVYRRNA